ncbi:hypothetical protein ACFQ0M_10070 [Kitasatospora aburaviensis]
MGTPPPERLLDLPIADRDLLLLAVRTSTYGHRFDVVLSCTACEQPMDVSFTATDIPVLPRRTPGAPLLSTLPDGLGGVLEVALRPPNGRDQEAVAVAAAGGDATPPVDLLLQRCLVGVDGGPAGRTGGSGCRCRPAERWPPPWTRRAPRSNWRWTSAAPSAGSASRPISTSRATCSTSSSPPPARSCTSCTCSRPPTTGANTPS